MRLNTSIVEGGLNLKNLERTYGGSKENPLIDKAYYCYTIYDPEYDRYYSGVKTNMKSNEHGLLVTYFTSSSVEDFVARLKKDPAKFVYMIEYFVSKEDAFFAESEYHTKYNVSKDQQYYNAINSCGSLCGSGSLLCRDGDRIYRVSTLEYANGGHTHVASGMINVYDSRVRNGTKLVKIFSKNYDPAFHTHELSGMVHAFDNDKKVVVRITKEEFDSNRDRFVGTTNGMVACYNINTGEYTSVPKDVYEKSEYLVGVTSKLNPNFKSPQKGKKRDKSSVYDMIEGVTKSVTKSEYQSGRDRYINSAIKKLYVVGDDIYTSKAQVKGMEYKEVQRENFKNYIGRKIIWQK